MNKVDKLFPLSSWYSLALEDLSFIALYNNSNFERN